MPGMARFEPTPKADKFKAGDTVTGHGSYINTRTGAWGASETVTGQLWSRGENPVQRRDRWGNTTMAQGKWWWVVTPERGTYLMCERGMEHVSSRAESAA